MTFRLLLALNMVLCSAGSSWNVTAITGPCTVQVAVFGFCDIRRFTDTTEVLQEGVMEFVNTIAHLVHGAVSARGGAANKNVGDAFLLVRRRWTA